MFRGTGCTPTFSRGGSVEGRAAESPRPTAKTAALSRNTRGLYREPGEWYKHHSCLARELRIAKLGPGRAAAPQWRRRAGMKMPADVTVLPIPDGVAIPRLWEALACDRLLPFRPGRKGWARNLART